MSLFKKTAGPGEEPRPGTYKAVLKQIVPQGQHTKYESEELEEKIEWQFEIKSGPHKGEEIRKWTGTSWSPASTPFKWATAILDEPNVRKEPPEPEELYNKPILLKTKVKDERWLEIKDESGKLGNAVMPIPQFDDDEEEEQKQPAESEADFSDLPF